MAFVGVKARVRVGVIVLIGALCSGCAAGGYSTSSLHKRLVQAGLTSEQATCVLDRMVNKFGDTQLNARTDPIAAEIQAERLLLRACGAVTHPPR